MENTRTRFIKTVIFNSLNDIDKIDTRVNGVIKKIVKKGGKIVSLIPIGWGISPMNLIYNIIYESEEPIDVDRNDKSKPTPIPTRPSKCRRIEDGEDFAF